MSALLPLIVGQLCPGRYGPFYLRCCCGCCQQCLKPYDPVQKELSRSERESLRSRHARSPAPFTKNVNNILRHAFDTGNIMPTSQLYARLYANYWTRKETGEDVRKLEAEPVHVLLHDGLQTPIILAPRGPQEPLSASLLSRRRTDSSCSVWKAASGPLPWK